MKLSLGRKVAPLLAMTVAALGYGLIWFCLKPTVFSHVKADFSCFYRAGRMVVAGDGAQVYDLPAELRFDAQLKTQFVDAGGHAFSLPFVFAPFVLLLFAPLSLLPYSQAELAWYLMNTAMLLALPFVLRRSLHWGNREVVLTLLAPVLFLPVSLALMQGQPSLLLLMIFAIAFVDLRAGHEARAGVVLALATFKPQLVIPMLLALAVMRRWKTLTSFCAGCAVLCGISIGLVGWHATASYPRAVMEFSRLAGSVGGEHPENMPNLRGFLTVVLPSQWPATAIDRTALALTAVLLTGMMLWLRDSRGFSETSYSLVLAVTVLVSYHAYLHDFSLLLLAVVLSVDHLARDKRTLVGVGLGAAVAAFYLIPLAPTSMRTTAVQMFVAVFLLGAMLSLAAATTEGMPRSTMVTS